MKIISTVLLLLGSGIGVDAAKNPHGFDPGFLKAMTAGSKSSPFLKDVTAHERKAFWRNLLKKAKPASEYRGLRSEKPAGERKLEENNYDQYANSNNYNNGQNNGYNGQYNYGNNQANYNYNGNAENADQYYDEAYYESQNEQDAYGVDWTNLGFDMKQYSLKYTGCSAVKTYDSTKAASGYDDVLSTKRFALFRLCPSNNCNKYSVNGCGRNYGEYVLEMDSFLEGVVEFNRQRYWHYCHFCRRCNGLETYGERMSQLSEEEMEFYEEMQAEAEAYYENQQAQYQQENENYANENAANYDYYNAYNQYSSNQNNANNAANGDNSVQSDENVNGYQNGGYYNNANGNNGQNYNNGNANRKVRKLKYPKTKAQLAGLRELYSSYQNSAYNQNANGEDGEDGSSSSSYSSSAQAAYYQSQMQSQYENGEIDEEEYQSRMEELNNNMYNMFFWDESVYGEWDEDWSETWLAFNWQVLPYCSESELMACQNADTMCEGYDEDFEEDADAMGGFAACTQIDDGLYIGPHCNSDGFTITLGVYKDAYCDEYIGNEVSLYDVLGYDISDDFDFFPEECVTCEEGGEEREFVQFMEANEDFDNYEEWLDTKWQEYIEMYEEQYAENMGDEQNQYYQTAQAYYQAQNYQEGNQEGYYYQNGRQYQNGGGAYYYGNSAQQNQYAQYSGKQNQNQQMAESYGNYGASMVSQGMNFYYNRAQAGDWITNERYDADEWQEQQAQDYGDYYWYRQSQKSFAKSGIADVCGALYTYAAKCNKHLTSTSTDYSSSNLFQYSFGVSVQTYFNFF